MKTISWTCDRCGVKVDVPWQLHIVEEYMPKALRHGFEPERPEGWWEIADDEAVVDACPDCITVVEVAERIVEFADLPF